MLGPTYHSVQGPQDYRAHPGRGGCISYRAVWVKVTFSLWDGTIQTSHSCLSWKRRDFKMPFHLQKQDHPMARYPSGDMGGGDTFGAVRPFLTHHVHVCLFPSEKGWGGDAWLPVGVASASAAHSPAANTIFLPADSAGQMFPAVQANGNTYS